MVSSLRPSDYPVLLSSLLFLGNSSDATRKVIVDSSDSIKSIPVVVQCTKCSDAMHRQFI
jgi:hypothetical protein